MTPSARYYITHHVFACISKGTLILLDTKKNNYHLVTKESLDLLMPFLATSGYNQYLPDGNCITNTDEINVHHELLQHDLLTVDHQRGKFLSPIQVKIPDVPFEILESDAQPEIKLHHAIVVFLSGILSYLLLLIPLKILINLTRSTHTDKVDPDTKNYGIKLARIYKNLRPLLPKSRICLFDSLSFTLFSKFYGLRTNLVFGVTPEPFEAHCWVQHDSIILNDAPQNIKKYTPIMVL